MSRCFAPVLLASCVLVLGLALESSARPSGEEPPLEFQIHIGGKAQAVRLDEAFHVEIEGKRVEMRLTAAPDRFFDNAPGISFRYPSSMAFEYDDTEPSVAIWTLDGSNCVLMLMRYTQAELTPEAARAGLVAQMIQQFGEENVKVSDASFTLGGTKMPTRRLDIDIAGELQRMDVAAFAVSGATCLFVVQDAPSGGVTSPETEAALGLVARTFKVGG